MRWSIVLSGLALACLPALAAHAGVPGNLRATLAKMHADQSITVSVSLRGSNTQGKKDLSGAAQATASLILQDVGGRLGVTYPAKLMQRLDAESAAHTKDASKPQPIKTLLNEFGPLDARSLVDFAPELLRRLAGATLQSTSQVTHDGKPAQLLVFKVPAHMDPKQQDDLDDYKGQLKVWLGPHGMPVAVAESRSFRFSKFFIHFDVTSSMAASLQQVGQRLVAVTYQSHGSGSGLGQSSANALHATLQVLATPPQMPITGSKP